MPNPRLAYKRVLADCSRGCSLNADRLPSGMGQLIHTWFEEGCNDREIRERAAPLGMKLSNGAISRHRANHLHAASSSVSPKDDGEEAPKMSDLDVIEGIIQTGAQQVKLTSAKVTTEQLLKAIELKHRLTEGSVFDAMFAAMAGEEDEAELMDDGGEDPLPGDADGPREGR